MNDSDQRAGTGARRRPPSPARPPGGGVPLWGALMVLTFAVMASRPLQAQAPEVVQAPDSVRLMRPISAFWRSLLIPGWGQAATQRWVTGATFTAWEGVCIMMTFKAQGEVKHIEAVGAGHVATKKQEVQDWAVLWIFNHLFAGAEAFVSAHLQDFPSDLHVRAMPRGLVVSISFPHP